MSAGVTEYILKSAQALPALGEALSRHFGLEKPAEVTPIDGGKKGLLIVFLSAKGAQAHRHCAPTWR